MKDSERTVLINALRLIRSILNQHDRNEEENEAFHIANRTLMPYEQERIQDNGYDE